MDLLLNRMDCLDGQPEIIGRKENKVKLWKPHFPIDTGFQIRYSIHLIEGLIFCKKTSFCLIYYL